MPSSFSFFKSANSSDRRSSTISIDSSRSSNGKSSQSHSPSSKNSTVLGSPIGASSRSTSRTEDNSQQQPNKRRQLLSNLSTKAVPATPPQQPSDPTRSSSVPSIDITSPSSDQPKPLFHPGQEDSSPRHYSSSFSSVGEETPVPQQAGKQGFNLPSNFARDTEEEEDRLFSISLPSSQQSMPRSSSVHSKSKGEPGGGSARKADRHDVMRRAMAEATSSDAFGGIANENGDDRSPSKSSIAPSISGGSMIDYGVKASDKIGGGSLSFEHFGQQGAEGQVVHADGTQPQAASNASGATVPSNSQENQPFPSRPKMGARNDSFHSEAGQEAPMTVSPAETNISPSAKTTAAKARGAHTMESSTSKGSSLTVPESSMSPDSRDGKKQMAESASNGKLLNSPIKRFRKLSDSGSINGSPKPSGGIAGAIAASSMAGMGVGHKNALQQSQPTTAKEKSGSRQSSVGGDYVSGYEGGLYRDPVTGKMVERGPDQKEGDVTKRAKFARDRSATGSTLSLAGSDYSIGSGLHAAANFSPSSAANLGFNAGFLSPEEAARRANEGGAPALTPGGIGAVGGLSPDGHGEKVGLGDEDPWPGAVGSQITGFAVASSKRNADFHNLFTSVQEDDYLIEDYGCALVREILIQGRLYVSENHVCFYANIFGWVTNIVLPFSEIVSTEKRMTAYVIPNAIQIATLHSKQTFASFLSRDTTFDLIVNIWKLSHPGVPTAEAAAEVNTDDESVDPDATKEVGQDGDKSRSDAGHDDSHPKKSKRKLLKKKFGIKENENDANGGQNHAQNGNAISRERSPQPGSKKGPHRKTSCPCEKDKRHYSAICIDTTYPAVPEKIYNLIYTSGFMKKFWTENQKLLDLQMSDWAPDSKNDNALTRSISYIKPLTGSFGPKQTKCLLSDENVHVDFDDYVVALTTTRTPDVPSGSSFSIKTRTCFTWAGGNVTKMYVTCQVEWTGRSMVKGIIERASVDGQKQYYKDLDVAIRKYIKEHASEFREEGDDQTAIEEGTGDTTVDTDDGAVQAKEKDAGDSEKGSTESKDGMAKFIDMASNAGTICFETISDAIGMISDLTGGLSPSVLILGLVVFLLVISNLWAMRSPSGRDPLDPHRLRASSSHRGTSRSHYRNQAETETAHAVAIAVREVLQDYFEPSHKGIMAASRVADGSRASLNVRSDDPLQELQDLLGLLDTVEQRVTNLREQLKSSSAEQSNAANTSKKGRST